MSIPSAIVMGVGPDRGLGATLCRRFAAEGLHVIAAGRTEERVEAVAAAIRDAGHSAEGVPADATSELDTVQLFERAGRSLSLAIYNSGNNTPGRIAEMDAGYFERSWRVGCFGGFLFGREAARVMRERGGGTVLFTGASASLRGRANFAAFNAAKGALRNFAQALAKEHGPDGIHVGHVVVDGPIAGDKVILGIPDYANEIGEERMIDIEGIVDGYLYLYRQPRRAWTFELDVRTSLERW